MHLDETTLSPAARAEVEPLTRSAQIIVGALALGVVAFAAVAWVTGAPPSGAADLLPTIALAAAGVAAVASWIVPGAIVAGARTGVAAGEASAFGRTPLETEEGRLATVNVMRTIVGCALLEGGALLNGVAFLLARETGNLAAMGLLAAGILAWMPTRAGMARFIGDQQRLLRDERR